MPALPGDAERVAAGAAARAGVKIAELHELAEIHEACALLDRVWRPGPGNPLMTPELLRVLGHAGGYAVGAYADGRLIGVSLGLLATAGLHSHITAVAGADRGRNVGYALKLHQRAWALERGITAVTWTFDPLVSRNAYVNLAKLGAAPAEYLVDFYGPMRDGVNAGTASDRLLVRWELAGPWPPAGERPPAGAVAALEQGAGGRPVRGRLDGAVVLVRVPSDVEVLRRADPAAAGEWRSAVREVLGGLMAEGRRVTGFTRDGRYVVR
ncbi:GNAT family N-acetyltransferase [Nonomuraea sp. NN258]|uniref:GNAT family N-acetyltransferase n=1 Tax=Nonomuraea antri TaxID=2730852 RepID=UPI0015686405|nr:GNAT family N-acetyltransferase [Nonomuraea antri]NRQ38283.1 GNAT family N-acetyltransferase [Nonomuraea antri]